MDNMTFDSNESDLVRLNTGDYFDDWTVYAGINDGTWATATLTFRDGTQVLLYQHILESCDRTGTYCYYTQQNKWRRRTLNGNFLEATDGTQDQSAGGEVLADGLPLSDTVGRSIGYSNNSGVQTITLQDSNNQTKTYTVNWASITGRDPYDSSNITLLVVQSIVLPNGRSYQLTYNSKGYVDTITFPSGAYVRYTYSRVVWGPGTAWWECSWSGGRDGWQVASRI